MCYSLHVAVNVCIDSSFVHLYLLIYYRLRHLVILVSKLFLLVSLFGLALGCNSDNAVGFSVPDQL